MNLRSKLRSPLSFIVGVLFLFQTILLALTINLSVVIGNTPYEERLAMIWDMNILILTFQVIVYIFMTICYVLWLCESADGNQPDIHIYPYEAVEMVVKE